MSKDNPFIEDDEILDAFHPFVRFVLPSVFVLMMLAGGVYWIKQQPAGQQTSNANGNVQVRLLPTPDVTPIPVQTTHQLSVPIGSAGEGSAERSEPEAEDIPLEPTPFATASAEPALPNINAIPPTVSSPPNYTAAKFQQALIRHIERFQHYPNDARLSHLEGTVQVAFVMGRDGKILDAWIRSSSGQIILDQEAVESLRRAEPLPSIPSELPNRLSILLPVSFGAQ